VGIDVVEVDEPDRIHQDANGAALIVTNYPVHMSDGRTVTEYIRTSPAIADIPILNATTHSLVTELDEATRAGVNRSVVLPVSMQELADAVVDTLASQGSAPARPEEPEPTRP
jgi:CheY-like chemotaxis protein